MDAILSMDSDEKLSKDMLEQMLKFVPSPDEQNLLNGHSDQLDLFARSDRFLYEMSRYFVIPSLVSCLHQKTFFTLHKI